MTVQILQHTKITCRTKINTNVYYQTPTPTSTPIPTPTPSPTASALVVHLDAGDPSSYSGSGSTWYDISGGAHDATLFNTPTYSSDFGGYLNFNDTSLEYGRIADIGSLSKWTVEVWVRFTSSLGTKVTSIVANEYDLIANLNFSIGTNNAPSNYNLAAGFFKSGWYNTPGFTPSTNTWYHIVGTYNGSIIRQYVDGVANGGTNSITNTPLSGGGIRLMRRWDAALISNNFVNGDLAIVKIYNTDLSSADVINNYNNDYSRFYPATPTPSPTPTSTPLPSPTTTLLPTSTPSPTPTSTPLPTSTPSPTPTSTPLPTLSPTPTSTPSASPSPTPTTTPSPTVAPTSGLVSSGLIVHLDASNPSSYTGSGTTWTNLIASGNNGVLTNGPTFSNLASGSIVLDGSNDYVTFTSGGLLKPSTTQYITAQAWVYPTQMKNQGVFGKLSNSFAFDGYIFGVASSGYLTASSNGSSISKQHSGSMAATVASGQWSFLSFSLVMNNTSGSLRGYVNTTQTMSSFHGTDGYSENNFLRVGQGYFSDITTCFKGNVGAVYFYDRQLSGTEIQQNFDATKTRYGL